MKNNIYKLGFLLLSLIVIISCESPEGEYDYTPAEYELPSTISLESNNITNSSFQFTYANTGMGMGYYVVVEGGSEAPTNQDIFDGVADGLISSGNFTLDGESITITDVSELCDSSKYDVYAVHFTSDSFLSDDTSELLNITTKTNQNIAGTYDVVTNGVLSGNFDGESVVDYTSVVTITDNGDGTFTFDDSTAGIYPEYYVAFAFIDPTFANPVPWTFDVPCNDISDVYDTTLAAFGDFIAFEAMINDDGSISVHWESAFGEVMDAVYIKQ